MFFVIALQDVSNVYSVEMGNVLPHELLDLWVCVIIDFGNLIVLAPSISTSTWWPFSESSGAGASCTAMLVVDSSSM